MTTSDSWILGLLIIIMLTIGIYEFRSYRDLSTRDAQNDAMQAAEILDLDKRLTIMETRYADLVRMLSAPRR